MRDRDKLPAWLRDGADELDRAHAALDSFDVPNSVPGSPVQCTLVARIALLGDRSRETEARLRDLDAAGDA